MSKSNIHLFNHAVDKIVQFRGFTIIELMVTIAVVAILSMIALPNLNNFTVKMRVDNEITELHRLLLTARNESISNGIDVTLCPLVADECTTHWGNELSVFIDSNNNGRFETGSGDRLIKIKAAIKSNDKLQYGKTRVTYAPTGFIANTAGTTPFSYCPQEDATLSRGIVVSTSGRVYETTDSNHDGKDEDRSGNTINCS